MQKAYDKMSPRCCRHFLRYGIRLKRLKEQNAKSMRKKRGTSLHFVVKPKQKKFKEKKRKKALQKLKKKKK